MLQTNLFVADVTFDHISEVANPLGLIEVEISGTVKFYTSSVEAGVEFATVIGITYQRSIGLSHTDWMLVSSGGYFTRSGP